MRLRSFGRRCEGKRSNVALEEAWIASSRTLLAMTLFLAASFQMRHELCGWRGI